MKNTFFALIGLFIATGAKAQCNELFISEYIEGTRNNKALEIYNPGPTAIDLSGYRITRWQNGSAVWGSQYSDVLSGSIGSNEVKVLVIDRRDTTQTGQDTPVTYNLRIKADLFLSKDYNTSFSMSFNGDDALSLDKLNTGNNQWVPVDIFGKIGQQPQLPSNPSRTIGWSDSFPYNTGLGLWCTIDKTLIRKASVTGGIKTNPANFNPRKEFEVYPVNTFDSLRTHNCICNKFPAQVKNIITPTLQVFPNPTSGNMSAFVDAAISAVYATDVQGRKIALKFDMQYPNGFAIATLNTAELSSGIYQLQAITAGNKTYTTRFIKQ
ncbi:MAG: T9SS C-terminal target domain-containing protein [Bacteroidetes bacterium]|nr:T9SS C-terminal target domain-containing protein [Bacteroidota bacterium]